VDLIPDGSSPHHFRGCFEKVRGWSDFPPTMEACKQTKSI
jgi:hypothetical protein